MKDKRVLIWSPYISDLYSGDVSGIAVQLYFWAHAFNKHGWHVFSLSNYRSYSKEGILFKKYNNWGKCEILHEWIAIFWKLVTIRPAIMVIRGARRCALPAAILCRLLGVKFVFFGASDVNFVPGEEQIAGGKINHKLWYKAVKRTKYFIVQNQYQHDTLKTNFKKDSLILYNIWEKMDTSENNVNFTDVVWVANYRPLKRPEWIIKAAKEIPEIDFTMVGGSLDDANYYKQIEESTKGINNLHFMGPRGFWETNSVVSKSRILCCTSTFEGFPNTFLQAWSYGIPVISTVNPSGLISDKKLGYVASTYDEFVASLHQVLKDEYDYNNICMNIKRYFEQYHSSDSGYSRLIDYILGW